MNSALTDREKDNLLKFWEAYNARNQWLLDDPWTPSFGQYPHTLELREPAAPVLTDAEDPAGRPGQHWDGTQTAFDLQEPPTESQDGGGSIFRGVAYLTLLYAFLGVVVMWVVPCIWGR